MAASAFADSVVQLEPGARAVHLARLSAALNRLPPSRLTVRQAEGASRPLDSRGSAELKRHRRAEYARSFELVLAGCTDAAVLRRVLIGAAPLLVPGRGALLALVATPTPSALSTREPWRRERKACHAHPLMMRHQAP